MYNQYFNNYNKGFSAPSAPRTASLRSAVALAPTLRVGDLPRPNPTLLPENNNSTKRLRRVYYSREKRPSWWGKAHLDIQ